MRTKSAHVGTAWRLGSPDESRSASNKCEGEGAARTNSQGTKRLTERNIIRDSYYADSFVHRDVVMRAGYGVQLDAAPRARNGSEVTASVFILRSAAIITRLN